MVIGSVNACGTRDCGGLSRLRTAERLKSALQSQRLGCLLLPRRRAKRSPAPQRPSRGVSIGTPQNSSPSINSSSLSGGTVSSYSWNVSSAPDLTGVTGTSTAQLQGTWKSFSGSARTDTISVTETSVGSPKTFTMTFDVASTSSPAYSSSRPTSSSTWPTVLTPDQISMGQVLQAAGPYASLGLADASVQTYFAMPSYNSSAPPSMSSGST